MKNSILLSGLIFFITPVSLNASHCQAIHEEMDDLYYQEDSSLHSTFQKYVSSIIPGIVVGANTGIFCALFDHLVPPLRPLFWVGSYFHRTKLVNTISEDYKRHHISHDKLIMELCALISVWVTHYKIYEIIQGTPPF